MELIRRNGGLIVAILLVVFVGVFFAEYLFTGSNKGSTEETKSTEETTSLEPQFLEEGQLWFLNAKGDTITQVAIEVADNEGETTQGLMFRKKMELQQAMLFVFPDEAPRSFWMKNTHISLDIIYVAADGSIVSSQNYATPYAETSLPSEKPAKYVVEVNAGFWDKYKLQKGDKVVFKRNG